MKKRVVLPFEKHPFCICYHNLAFPFGMIQGNGNCSSVDIVSWMLRKFTNCVFDENMSSNKYEICLCDAWGIIDQLTTHQNINFKKSTFELFEIDILNFVKKLIDAEFYVTGMYNEKYILGKRAFNEYDYWHDYILYGYDDEKKVFYSAGFMENGNFEQFEVPYKNFLTSINNEDKNISFNLHQFNKNAPVKFNVIRITNLLKDYINSTTKVGHRLNGYYGIEANIKLKEFLKKCCECDEDFEIDLRYTRAFMEHKFFIRLAIYSLYEKNWLELTQKQLDKIEDVYKKSQLIHLLGLKVNISNNRNLVDKIVEHFETIEKVELELLPMIISKLEKNLPETV